MPQAPEFSAAGPSSRGPAAPEAGPAASLLVLRAAATRVREPQASSPVVPAARVPSIQPVPALSAQARAAPADQALVPASAPALALADPVLAAALAHPAELPRLPAKLRALRVPPARLVAVAASSIPRPKKA